MCSHHLGQGSRPTDQHHFMHLFYNMDQKGYSRTLEMVVERWKACFSSHRRALQRLVVGLQSSQSYSFLMFLFKTYCFYIYSPYFSSLYSFTTVQGVQLAVDFARRPWFCYPGILIAFTVTWDCLIHLPGKTCKIIHNQSSK